MRIGLDFDNTIICYDKVFVDTARQQGSIPSAFEGNKQEVRDAIRQLADGETRWQMLQGHVYGRGIGGARPFAGLDRFLLRARNVGAVVLVISHKTEFGHYDSERVSLRDAALDWMRQQGFFSEGGFGMDEANVHLPRRAPKSWQELPTPNATSSWTTSKRFWKTHNSRGTGAGSVLGHLR